jgi:hypothetical protein
MPPLFDWKHRSPPLEPPSFRRLSIGVSSRVRFDASPRAPPSGSLRAVDELGVCRPSLLGTTFTGRPSLFRTVGRRRAVELPHARGAESGFEAAHVENVARRQGEPGLRAQYDRRRGIPSHLVRLTRRGRLRLANNMKASAGRRLAGDGRGQFNLSARQRHESVCGGRNVEDVPQRAADQYGCV